MTKKGIKSLIVFLTIMCVSFTLQAQDSDDTSFKFMVDAGFGKSNVRIGSNISPWGVHYRGNYNNGIYVNLQGSIIFKDNTTLGLKWDLMSSYANYEIDDGRGVARVSDNVSISYFAPQFGFIGSYSTKFSISLETGVGYAGYQSFGLLELEEYRIYSHMLGLNLDISLSYLSRNKVAFGCKSSTFAALPPDKLHSNIGGTKDKIKMDKTNQIYPAIFNFSVFLRRYF